MTDLLPQTMLGRVLAQSFKNWASKDSRYKSMYKKLPPDAFTVINDFLLTEENHKPGTYDFWWANEHMRYKGMVKDEVMRNVHELMYHFLTKYVRGTLKDESVSSTGDRASGTKKSRRQAENE